jgi:glycosyltransferase involved in cell wall biosynthesis
MGISSAGLSPLPDRPDFHATINNKTIEYLAGGLPVISSPRQSVVARLLSDNKCGAVYDSRDFRELVDLLMKWKLDDGSVKMMAANATRLYRERFIARNVYSEMADHIERVVVEYGHGRSRT